MGVGGGRKENYRFKLNSPTLYLHTSDSLFRFCHSVADNLEIPDLAKQIYAFEEIILKAQKGAELCWVPAALSLSNLVCIAFFFYFGNHDGLVLLLNIHHNRINRAFVNVKVKTRTHTHTQPGGKGQVEK